ncbi:MAG: UvrD-helicase domain-containing protein [Oscillospiraceae bacterium]|nr:UvrD-helicase domain-containing protein [Oscillospiraceae bacterium]
MKWTQQQETAITERGRSIIVSAAAGSGKTAVLVERLLRILSSRENGVRSENIVVVTFTNDAAAQMKQRLYQALSELISSLDDTADEEDYLWLIEQQSGLSSAKISTINAFCFDLIRENAELCGVSSQFRIAEPSEEAIYVRHALQSVLENWNKTRLADIETLFSFFCTRNDSEMEGIILAIAEYMKSLAFAEHWMEKVISACTDKTMLLETIRCTICQELTEILAFLERSEPYAQNVMTAGNVNRFYELYCEDRTNILFHLNYLKNVEPEKLLEAPLKHEACFSDFSRVSKNTDPENKNIFRQFREIYKARYKAAVKTYLNPLQYFEEDLAVQGKIIPLLLALTQDFRTELFEEKKRRNVLAFDDGERLALSLLGEVQEDGSIVRTSTGDQLAAQYSLVMVDEYQDCNNKQDCLFKLLSKGCTCTENGLSYGNNAFLVGDVKQSIYSFRQANPRNFMQALTDSTPLDACISQETARIYLNQNFRSSEGVITFVNSLCSMLMSEKCGEVNYDKNEFLYFGAEHYTDAPHTRTKLLLTDGEVCEEDADTQAECVAAHIAEMLAEKITVTERDGTVRPCRPSDFCILLRSVKADGNAVIAALKKRNIPVSGEESFDFLERPEIRIAYHFLRIIDNPLTDISMAAVLLSPVYGFTVQDLMELKNASRSNRIYLQLLFYAENQTGDGNGLQTRCAEFLAQFEKLRVQADALPLEEFVQYLYDETDLPSLQILYEDAPLRCADLSAFQKLAKDYRVHAEGTIGDFLRYIDSMAERGLEIGGTPQTAENCVSIKTIHKSKGLEYPFVLLVHPEHPFSTKPRDALFHTNDAGLLGLRLIDRENYSKSATSIYHYLLADVFRRQRSEEMRLFYVALTRARQQLIIAADRSDCYRYCLGAYKPKAGKDDELYMAQLLQHCPSAAADLAANADSMLEWILLYLLSGEEAPYFLSAVTGESDISSPQLDYSICRTSEEGIESEPECIETDPTVDLKILALMQEQLAFRYESDQKDLIAKYSVTSLAHSDDETEQSYSTPAFLRESKEQKSTALQGARRGTAVHKILQLMDFNEAVKDVQTELDRLEHEGKLTAQEVGAIPTKKLQAFFSSSLYDRIAASDNVQKEKQFFVRIGELALPQDSQLYQNYADTDGILIGTMDLLFHEEDGWVLVDYKTDANKTAEELIEHYQMQLALYQKAAELIFGERIKQAYIYSFTHDTAIAVDTEQVDSL